MLSLIVLALAVGNVICDLEVPVVETCSGQVSGVYEKNEDGDHFLYMGIPYALVPDDNIFGDAIEALPWEGILEGNDESTKCPQRENFNNTIVGTTNCTKLNVYRPAKPKTNSPLPVYFFVYGGEFEYGYASRYQWGPEMLTSHDVIVVTINYRTGIFGFMCLDIAEVPGNSGYKDLILGLNWVQDNIAAFGGDPKSVTLAGSSSGAFAVEWLLTSPLAEGLFHRIILESGSATAVNWIGSDSKEYVLDMATEIGYGGELTISNAWSFLNKQSIEDIIVATETLNLTFGGCIEKEFDGVKRLAYGHPKDLIPKGEFMKVDVLAGFNSAEGLVRQGKLNLTEEHASLFVHCVGGFVFKDEAERENTIELIRRFYIGDEPVSNHTKRQMIHAWGDSTFVYPLYRAAQSYSKYVTVYLYEFAYDGDHNFSKKGKGITLSGASHADEIGYIFRADQYFEKLGIGFNATDRIVMDFTTTMFTNFAKYGNPTPQISENTPVIWKPIDGSNTNYLVIDKEMAMKKEPLHDRIAFWELLYRSYYDRVQQES